MEIDGQVAVVTGGASGLGEATARHLAALGADVVILDRDGGRAAQVAAEISGYAQQCDVAEEESAATGITCAMARYGQAPRIVVNCAGLHVGARILGPQGKVSTPIFRRLIDVNLVGSYNIMTYAAQAMMDLPPLEDGARGVIVNTASVAFEDGQPGQAAYAASGGAIAAMTLPAAREFAALGIRVMAIAPGLFRTAMAGDLPDAVAQAVTAEIPFPNRPGLPAEFARMAADIVTNPYLNGTVIRLDGAVRLPWR